MIDIVTPAVTYWPAPAKLNLSLHINGIINDHSKHHGYHQLQSIIQFLDHSDQIAIEINRSDTIEVFTNINNLATKDNLIFKAAMALKQYTLSDFGAKITLTKILPIGSGLGGGSSNAATILIALNHLCKLGLSVDQLSSIAVDLGADVPVFIRGHAAIAEGIGEKLTSIDIAQNWYLVVKPPVAIATAQIFSHPNLTRNTPKFDHVTLINMSRVNDFEKIVRISYPDVDKQLSWLLQYAPSRLTGSGSCVFAEFSSKNEALSVFAKLPNPQNAFVAQGVNVSPLKQYLLQKVL